jgi:tRNA-2-methylthio-N6-dimethylallyladenosine synthase
MTNKNSNTTGKRLYIVTYGCQMNDRDSEVVKGLLIREGYELADDPDKADVIFFNTCSVRQHAEDKVWSAIGRFAKRKGPSTSLKTNHDRKKIIGVIGCMAQNYQKEIFKRAPAVDIVCGPDHIDNIALYLGEALRKRENVLGVGEKKRKDEIYHTGFYEEKDHAYVVISEGCDNFCSYCVVPYVRGRLRHRSPSKIIQEVQEAIENGITNVTLLGQNVNSYASGEWGEGRECKKINFVDLLRRTSEIKGLKSLSFITSHPKDTTKELFELMRDTPLVRRYLHLPVQSGSDKILYAMNRQYTVKKYLEIVDQYRRLLYNGQLSTDVIVGFPTETEEDFKKTKELMEAVCFDSAYIFKYSPRPHTKAAQFKDDVPQEIKEKRHARLLELQKKISKSKKYETEG